MAAESTVAPMSVAEIKQQIRSLTEAERMELRNFIEQMRLAGDVEWQQEMARRNAAMDRGEKATLEELEQLHEDLIQQGR